MGYDTRAVPLPLCACWLFACARAYVFASLLVHVEVRACVFFMLLLMLLHVHTAGTYGMRGLTALCLPCLRVHALMCLL